MGDVKRFNMKINLVRGEDDVVARVQVVYSDSGPYVLHSDYSTLLTRHNALVEAVAWERETALHWEFGRIKRFIAEREALESMFDARAEVDKLLTEES